MGADLFRRTVDESAGVLDSPIAGVLDRLAERRDVRWPEHHPGHLVLVRDHDRERRLVSLCAALRLEYRVRRWQSPRF